MPCAVANAISLQSENIIADFPFRPENELMTSIRRVMSMARSSSRISSAATDTDTGSMFWRAGSISARHVGHVFFVFKDKSKQDVQYLCPHAVMDTFIGFRTSKHTAHTGALGSSSFDDDDDVDGWLHQYCIGSWGWIMIGYVHCLHWFCHLFQFLFLKIENSFIN
jgi:hypothetical protein